MFWKPLVTHVYSTCIRVPPGSMEICKQWQHQKFCRERHREEKSVGVGAKIQKIARNGWFCCHFPFWLGEASEGAEPSTGRKCPMHPPLMPPLIFIDREDVKEKRRSHLPTTNQDKHSNNLIVYRGRVNKKLYNSNNKKREWKRPTLIYFKSNFVQKVALLVKV